MALPGHAGWRAGSLALATWICACSSSGPAAPAKAAPALTVPVSINGGPAQPLTLTLDSDGFTPSILSLIPGPETGPWMSFEVDGAGTAKLLIALVHYPDAEPVLHQEPGAQTVQAGLRSKKTGVLMPGFVTESPCVLAFYDEGHLQSAEASPSTPLPVQFPDPANKVELLAAGLQELATYAQPGAKGKSRWWRLRDALHRQVAALGPQDLLIVHYEDQEGIEQRMELHMDELDRRPESALLKVNRRGEWKLSVVAPDGEIQTVHARSIEVRARQ